MDPVQMAVFMQQFMMMQQQQYLMQQQQPAHGDQPWPAPMPGSQAIGQIPGHPEAMQTPQQPPVSAVPIGMVSFELVVF